MTVLFVIATILFFLGLDWVVRRARGETFTVPAVQPAASRYPLRVPGGIFFAKSHTWLNLWPSGKIRIGVDDFVGRLMESPKVTFLKTAGDKVERGEPILALEEGGKRLTLRSPITGTIVRSNAELERKPGLMRDALFSDGWAYTMQPGVVEELRGLMLGDETRNWMSREFEKLRDLLIGSSAPAMAPALLQDGGEPAQGVLKHLDVETCRRFEQTFLQTGN